MCLKKSRFLDCRKVSSVALVFKNVGKKSTENRPSFDFQYGFRSSRLTADLLSVVSDRIARAFTRSGATRAVALDISKDFCRN